MLNANPAATIALYKIDLDGFTVVNEGLGRRVGDQLLRSVAARLQAVVAGEKATVARFGADEFAILLERTPASPDVATVAARINSELAEPVFIEPQQNFRVEMLFPQGVPDSVKYAPGPLRIWVVLDGYLTRDAQ